MSCWSAPGVVSADVEQPPGLVGGPSGSWHINGGSFAIDQQLLFCPGLDWWRWGTPLDGLYLASAAVPPAPELAWRHWEPPVCARTQGTEPENLDVDKMLEPGASPAPDGYEGREAALQEIEAARGSGPVDPHPTDPAMPAWPPAQSGRGRPSG